MTKRTLKAGMALLCLGFFLVSAAHLGSEEALHRVWAIKDCRLVSPGGPAAAKATILIRDGLIEAVGPSVAVPADAEVIDGSKLTVHPGLIDALGQSLLKLPEEKFDTAKFYSGEFTDKDRGLTPELKAFDYVILGKSTLEKYHKAGFLAAAVIPPKGIFTGQASFFSLSSEDKNKALVLKDNWLGLSYSPSSFSVYPNSLMGVVALLRQEFADVAYFNLNTSRWKKELKGLSRPDYNGRYDTLADYVSGKKPVVFL